jgi:hypothetical protein
VSNNLLTGKVPRELQDLKNLELLDVSDNQLEEAV